MKIHQYPDSSPVSHNHGTDDNGRKKAVTDVDRAFFQHRTSVNFLTLPKSHNLQIMRGKNFIFQTDLLQIRLGHNDDLTVAGEFVLSVFLLDEILEFHNVLPHSGYFLVS